MLSGNTPLAHGGCGVKNLELQFYWTRYYMMIIDHGCLSWMFLFNLSMFCLLYCLLLLLLCYTGPSYNRTGPLHMLPAVATMQPSHPVFIFVCFMWLFGGVSGSRCSVRLSTTNLYGSDQETWRLREFIWRMWSRTETVAYSWDGMRGGVVGWGVWGGGLRD